MFECIAFTGVACLIFAGQDSFMAYGVRVCLILLILLSIFGMRFYGRFRSGDASDLREKKRVARYSSDRRDIEEKISSLQTQINSSGYKNWQDSNRLPMSAQGLNRQDSEMWHLFYLEEFKKSFGITEDVLVKPGLVFMIMPFNHEATSVYWSCKEAVGPLGLELRKSDDEYVAEDLLRHIIKLILSSEYIIANLDGKNPNVFYELGIAHSLGKRTILIASLPPSEIPFNVSNRNIIFYQDAGDLGDKLRKVFRVLMDGERDMG